MADNPDDNMQSLGGKARAASLTKEQRSEIARHAAASRWERLGKGSLPVAQYGSEDKPLRVGDVEIACYVLDDGRRVVVQGGMMRALDMRQGTAGRGAGDRLAKFVNTKSLSPFVPKKLADVIIEPIRFRTVRGGEAYGYEATILAEICDAVLDARKRGKLNYQQEHIAARCEILARAFMRVGIIALVDEATGYQDARAKDALAKFLERFIAKELQKWIRTFPDDFYREMYRLRGMEYPPKALSKPGLIGKLTNEVVYDRLAPGVREELRRITPRNEKGRLKQKYHQHLTTDIGHPKLREHLAAVVAVMKLSRRWDDFIRKLDQVAPKFNHPFALPLDDGQ